MMAAHAAGAASHEAIGWHQIDWYKAQRVVRRLQARIVKATQAGRWGKVTVLQHLLTHSFSGKALAVRRVTENQGKNTPGVDGMVWNTPEKKMHGLRAMRRRGYKPQPLRRTYIPKSNGKMRPLSIPTIADRAMQALHLLALDPVAETTGDPNSYGFRHERSAADAMEQCYLMLAGRGKPTWVLEGDIKSCFDKISHDWLLAHIPMDKGMLRKWLKAGYVEKRTLYPMQEGTPQGGVISPVLANLTLDGLERRLMERFPIPKRRGLPSPKVHLIRYADDFLITGSSKELLEQEVRPLVEHFLRERGLELSSEKTHITSIDQGFDFLGFHLRRYRDTYLAKPSKKSVKTLLGKVRQLVKDQAQAPAGKLIFQLNLLLRGWTEYFRHEVSARTFGSIDKSIFWTLWRWAKRRHSNKNSEWIRRKYFHSVGSRRWVFSGEVTDHNGRNHMLRLLYAYTVSIRRHVKIRGAANPYDPVWEEYFEQRLGVKMLNNLSDRRRLLYLWREQSGRCPVCQARITRLTGWHVHHIIPRAEGGRDTAANRVLLHPTCHQQVHSQKISVAKPRPSRGETEA